MLPKNYLKQYDGETKWICFLIEDDDLLKKSKVSADIKKRTW